MERLLPFYVDEKAPFPLLGVVAVAVANAIVLGILAFGGTVGVLLALALL